MAGDLSKRQLVTTPRRTRSSMLYQRNNLQFCDWLFACYHENYAWYGMVQSALGVSDIASTASSAVMLLPSGTSMKVMEASSKTVCMCICACEGCLLHCVRNARAA